MLGKSNAFCTKGEVVGPKWAVKRQKPPMDRPGDLGVGLKNSRIIFK